MPNLLWLDLETTGLEPMHDRILEVGFVLAPFDQPFKLGGVVRSIVIHDTGIGLSAFIREMHGKNGLLLECATSRFSLLQAEEELLLFVPEIEDKDEKVILAGASVHFDLGFLRVHMPRVAARLSHRLYDTSAIKLFCQSLGMPKFAKAEAHRAKDDILECATHGQACADWLLRDR
jgi:oligoribonuclease